MNKISDTENLVRSKDRSLDTEPYIRKISCHSFPEIFGIFWDGIFCSVFKDLCVEQDALNKAQQTLR